MLTDKQRRYCEARARGVGAGKAALEAGYARGSAAVLANRLENNPRVKSEIERLRGAKPVEVFEDAAAYLHAVARGLAVPDPARIAAARAILPYTRSRERVPLKSRTPRDLARAESLAAEEELLAAWALKAAKVRAKLAKEKRRGDSRREADADSVQGDPAGAEAAASANFSRR